MNLTVAVGLRHINIPAVILLLIVLISIVAICIGLILYIFGIEFGETAQSLERSSLSKGLWSEFEADLTTGIVPTFASLLALFYPSVTDVMVGSTLSASLAHPSHSIPRGTLSAVLVTSFLYVFFIFGFGSGISRSILKENKLVAATVSWPDPMLVKFGIILSSMGAGLQSLISAPILLDSIASDRTIPILAPFATFGDFKPTLAIAFTWLLSTLPCLTGALDYIAPVVTISFLIMYFTLNCACFSLSISESPNWKPKWKYFHWRLVFLYIISQ